MNRITVQSIIAVVMAGNLSIGMCASPVIGTVQARGSFEVDNSQIAGNATLFEGTTIQTLVTSSALELRNGARVLLASDSKARIYGDRLVLERGETQLDQGTKFRIEARNLQIVPETSGSIARIALTGSSRVQVAALAGAFQITNSKGVLVANLTSGNALEFDPQANEPATSKIAGCVSRKTGHYLVTDETTNVTVELVGAGLEKEVGHRVEVVGTIDQSATPTAEASQLIRVSSVKRSGKGCQVSSGTVAAGAATGGVAAGGAAAGAAISGTTVAIVGGVAAAATVGGLAAAGKLPGQGNAAPATISR